MDIHPSPVKNLLSIDLGVKSIDEAKVTLYNMFGQVVLTKIIQVKNGIITLQLATLSYGAYQANIQAGNQTFTKKIVKQ